jgi:hypothetical protein
MSTRDDLRRALDVVGAARGSLDGFDVVVQLDDGAAPEPWEAAGATWWLTRIDPFGIDLADVRRRIATR